MSRCTAGSTGMSEESSTAEPLQEQGTPRLSKRTVSSPRYFAPRPAVTTSTGAPFGARSTTGYGPSDGDGPR